MQKSISEWNELIERHGLFINNIILPKTVSLQDLSYFDDYCIFSIELNILVDQSSYYY